MENDADEVRFLESGKGFYHEDTKGTKGEETEKSKRQRVILGSTLRVLRV